MNNRDSLLMYDYFYSLEIPFKSGRINMWSPNNKYSYVPFFKFKFNEVSKNHKYYKILINAIDKYVGLVQWELVTEKNVSNFILRPKKKSKCTCQTSEKVYIEKVINDIPTLVNWLKNEVDFSTEGNGTEH